MIQSEGLSVRYGDGGLALNHVSFNVEKGEAYCVLGRNGAGKTTIINVFLGLVPLTTGRASVNGAPCGDSTGAALRNIALLSERPAVYEYLTCRRNVELLARLSGAAVPSPQALLSAFREVGLPDRALESGAKGLSPVWKLKVLLAAAVVRDVPALLLDDPTRQLDAVSSNELKEALRRFKARGGAVLLATDDPIMARDLADRIGILDRGLLVQELDPRAITDQELLTALRSNYTTR